MKTTPFQSLGWMLLLLVIAVLLWPVWWLLFAFFAELSWIFLLPIFLAFCACLIWRFTRQLDAVEGPFPRARAKGLSGQAEDQPARRAKNTPATKT